jgi:DNA-binding MarR family transcriptional regulator
MTTTIKSRDSRSPNDWHRDLLVSWLFQTCFKLQNALDRRFFPFGTTFQEAAVLMYCVDAGEISPGRLAVALARDKGAITRFLDRLEASCLVKREPDPADRRRCVIKATSKGKRISQDIATNFGDIRQELFTEVLDADIDQLATTLRQLHRNASRVAESHHILESVPKTSAGKKIGSRANTRPATPSRSHVQGPLPPKGRNWSSSQDSGPR